MASLRYVCLSDLHLGAGYSILTPIGSEGDFVNKGGDSVQEKFATALRAYVLELSETNSTGVIFYIILNSPLIQAH